ncbi:MAG: hypothetical protein ACRCZF_27710 [Gemmataceae bacterium]
MDASTLIPVCVVAFVLAFITLMLIGRAASKHSTPGPGPRYLDNVTIDGKPGQKAILYSMEDLMRMAGELEKAEQGPKRPVLYMFQHVALRDAAFENHPELIRELSEPPRTELPLLHFRSKAKFRCLAAGLLSKSDYSDEAVADSESELFEAVRVQPVSRGGYTAHIVTMPAPQECPEAYFAAIVHKDGEPREYRVPSPSTRYFTLELAIMSDRPVLCEWLPDESRKNYGAGPAPEIGPFADAVFEHVGVDR